MEFHGCQKTLRRKALGFIVSWRQGSPMRVGLANVILLSAFAGCRGGPIQPAPAARLELSPIDADVWVPIISIRGEILGRFAAMRCEIAHHDVVRTIVPTAASFRIDLELGPGSNLVNAQCFDPDGRVLQAQRVTYRNRALRESRGKRQYSRDANSAWLDNSVIYGLLPPLYGAPPLQAATNALPALAELGINALWLAPVMATPKGNFGYAVTDYFSVRKDYGTEADLKLLVDRAHSLGIKVLLDFVPNHTSDQHPYFVQAEQFGVRSHYFHFYERASNGASQHYFDWKDLPNLDYSNREVAAFVTAASEKWLEDFGIDGYRVDAAWGIEQRQPNFYDAWSRHVRTLLPSAVLIAEASARDPFYLQHGFDAAYDWTHELGHWAWEKVFDDNERIAARLAEALVETSASTRRVDRVLRFLNNNDTGARFVTRHGVALTRAATVVLLTLPGIPCLYSFDEVGGEFEPYSGIAPFHGPTHSELQDFHRRLIGLRRDLVALHGPDFKLLETGNPAVLAYVRWNRAQRGAVLIVVNFSSTPQRASLQAPDAFTGGRVRDLLEPGRTMRLGELSSLTLPAFGYAMWMDVESAPAGRN